MGDPQSDVAFAERLRARLRSPDGRTAALLAVACLATFALPRGLPPGILATAIVFAARTSLAITGVVLVHRSSRILSFAQVPIGFVGATLFAQVVRHHTFVGVLRAACGCVPTDPALAPRWAIHLEYWSAAALAVVLSVVLSLATYAVVARFRSAPPLVGTVVTIAVATLLAYASGPDGVLRLFDDREPAGATPPPLDAQLAIGSDPRVVLHLPELLALAAATAAILGLVAFFRRSRLGVAVRAAAESPERAATLGIGATAVTATVWTIAGVLSGVAGVLIAMVGPTTAPLAGSTLVRVFGAVVIAGLTNLPLAVFAGTTFAILDQASLWSFGNAGLVEVTIFGLLLVLLLLRPQPRTSRVDAAGTWQAAREARPVPAELRDLPEVRGRRRRLAGAGALALLGLPFALAPDQVAGATTVIVYGIVGLSLLVLSGWAGLISLGQFAFAAVGGFGVALVGGRWGMPLLVALPAAGLLGALAAVLVGLPALRLRGLYLAITTLALAVVTSTVLLSERYGGRLIPATLDRPSILGLDAGDERTFYFVALAVLGLATAAVIGLRRSRAARALIAARDNERAAQAYGVGLVRVRLATFAVSGLLAAAAGGLLAYRQQGVPAANYSVEASLSVFLMVVIGGLGSVAGPLLGALFTGSMTVLAPELIGLSSAIAVIVLLLLAPGGLSQLAFGARDARLRRIAVRRRILVPSLLADMRVATALTAKAPIRPIAGGDASVPVRYRLHRTPLSVAKVAAAGKGATG